MHQPSGTFWDLLGQIITLDSVKQHNEAIKSQADEYAFTHFKLLMMFLGSLVLIGLGVFFLMNYLLMDITRQDDSLFIIFSISIVPLLIVIRRIRNFQKETTLFRLAQQNNWAYASKKDPDRLHYFQLAAPEVFVRGRNQEIASQLWCFIGEHYSYICRFSYVEGYGKSQTTYEKTLTIVGIERELPTTCLVERKSLFSAKTVLTTESDEFNRTFSVRADMTQPEQEVNLRRIFSPAVQIELLKLARQLPQLDAIYMYSNYIIYEVKGDILTPPFWSFLFQAKALEKQMQHFKPVIQVMSVIPLKISQYLD